MADTPTLKAVPAKDVASKKAAPATAKNVESATSHGNRPKDDILGAWVNVTSGDNKGRYGAVLEITTRDKDGFPVDLLVRTRDDSSERLTVNIDDLELAAPGRR